MILFLIIQILLQNEVDFFILEKSKTFLEAKGLYHIQ